MIDPVGEWLGEVQPPAGLEPHEIGADYVIGVWRDELDVEYARTHDLVRPL